MNKWLNPEPRQKETPQPTTIGKGISFDTIKTQVGKKLISANPIYLGKIAERKD
jgi:hypothetical protein